MRTLKKEHLIAVLTVIFLGILSFTSVVGAGNPRRSTQSAKGHGLYVKQGQKTFRLQQKVLAFKTALVLGSDKSGFYGIPSPPQTRLDIKPIEIWLFDPETAGATIRLAKMGRIETAPAHSFDLQATKFGPDAFDKIYHMNYDESLPVNLWCIENDIPLQITPVAKKQGWYRVVPQQELDGGAYAINFGGADGPRNYTGEVYFYPFVLASAAEPKNPQAEKPAMPNQTPSCP